MKNPLRFAPGRTLLALAALVFFLACLPTPDESLPPPLQGGGSDTETLKGWVRDGANAPAAHVRLKLIPSDYDPSHPDSNLIRRTLSDDTGHFEFKGLDSSRSYNLIAGDPDHRAWALAAGLRAGASRAISLSLAKVFLFSLHGDGYTLADSGIAYFPGTDILAHCGGLSPARVDSVPAGVLRFIVASRAGWQHDTTLAAAADTTKIAASRARVTLLP